MAQLVRTFRSTDVGAPLLTGEAGSLINVLDACLVNGYGSVSISGITRSGAVATATTAAVHNYVTGNPIRISGAGQTEYNGDFAITVTGTNTFTYTVTGTPATPATGTLTALRAPLDFTKAFAGTSKAAYRLPAYSTQHYLQVLDDQTGANQRYALVRGFEDMLSADAGTGQFPATATQTNWAVKKSDTQSSASRPWSLHGDDECFWLFTHPTNVANSEGYFFGAIDSYKAGDAYHTAIRAANTLAVTLASGHGNDMTSVVSALGTTQTQYLARAYNQIGSPVAYGHMGDYGVSQQIGGTTGGMDYPSPVDNGFYVAPIRVAEAAGGGVLRGQLPGLYQMLHNSVVGLDDGATVTGILGLPGRTLELHAIVNGPGSAGYRATIDITGPWRA